MPTSRLTFLYPHLFRSVRNGESAVQTIRLKKTSKPPPRYQAVRHFATTHVQRDNLVERHGKAVEPFLAEGEAPESVKVYTPEPEIKADVRIPESQKELEPSEAKEAQKHIHRKDETKDPPATSLFEELQAPTRLPGDADSHSRGDNEVQNSPMQVQEPAINTADTAAPLENVLHMPPPETQEEEDAAKPPHLQAPPYVHHFDTYTLVQQVEAGGFTPDQSITTMKAVRALLADNLELARASLVSKSDVENVSYSLPN